ncbi:hypothetical protein COOONC_15738 [Cooperia oncophora]
MYRKDPTTIPQYKQRSIKQRASPERISEADSPGVPTPRISEADSPGVTQEVSINVSFVKKPVDEHGIEVVDIAELNDKEKEEDDVFLSDNDDNNLESFLVEESSQTDPMTHNKDTEDGSAQTSDAQISIHEVQTIKGGPDITENVATQTYNQPSTDSSAQTNELLTRSNEVQDHSTQTSKQSIHDVEAQSVVSTVQPAIAYEVLQLSRESIIFRLSTNLPRSLAALIHKTDDHLPSTSRKLYFQNSSSQTDEQPTRSDEVQTEEDSSRVMMSVETEIDVDLMSPVSIP